MIFVWCENFFFLICFEILLEKNDKNIYRFLELILAIEPYGEVVDDNEKT